MSKIKIYGGKYLSGTVKIHGSKNACLPIMCASLLNKGKATIGNVPKIADVYNLLNIFSYLNVSYTFVDDFLVIDSSKLTYKDLLIAEVLKFRASYYLIGVFLALFGKCKIYYPGGCKLGERPLDYHFEAFKAMGYNVNCNENLIEIDGKLKNDHINITLKGNSVGATINTVFATIFSNATIYNYSLEPEVVDTLNFLNKLGFKIIKNRSIEIFTSIPKRSVKYKIIPDRIEALTYIIMALLCGNIKLENVNLLHIDYPIRTLILNNADIIMYKNVLCCNKSKVVPFSFDADLYPKIPTDAQPLFSILFLFNNGSAIIGDKVFKNRFSAPLELVHLGARINTMDNKIITNHSVFVSGSVKASDLRACAALFLFAIASPTNTVINNYEIIERGYADFLRNLKNLGVKYEIIE